jgi:hypothetical protein
MDINDYCYLLLIGVLGVKVKIMLDCDPTGRSGPKNPLPDVVTIMVSTLVVLTHTYVNRERWLT